MEWQKLFGDIRSLLHKTDITSPGELVPGSVWRGQLTELFEKAHMEHPAQWEDAHNYVRHHWIEDHDEHPLLCLKTEREFDRWNSIAPFASFFLVHQNILENQLAGFLGLDVSDEALELDFFQRYWYEKPGAERKDKIPSSALRTWVWPYKRLWFAHLGPNGDGVSVVKKARSKKGFTLDAVLKHLGEAEVELRNMQTPLDRSHCFFQGFRVGRDGSWEPCWAS